MFGSDHVKVLITAHHICLGNSCEKKPHNSSHNTVTAAVTDMYNSTFYIHTSYSEQMYTFDMWCCVNFEQMNNLLQ